MGGKILELNRKPVGPVGGQVVNPAGIPMQAVFFPHGGAVARCKRQLSALEIVTDDNADMIDVPAGCLMLFADPATARSIMGPLGVKEDAGTRPS
jgi:hypothetical protein